MVSVPSQSLLSKYFMQSIVLLFIAELIYPLPSSPSSTILSQISEKKFGVIQQFLLEINLARFCFEHLYFLVVVNNQNIEGTDS